MIKKVLTLAKNTDSFSIDYVLMMTGLALSEAEDILKKLIDEQRLKKENDKYFLISKFTPSSAIEIVERASIKERKNYGLNFIDASKIFFEEHVNKNCSKLTQMNYRTAFKQNLNFYFKDFLIEDIKIEDIVKFKEFCIQRGYSDTTIRTFLSVLMLLLKHFRISDYSKTLCEFKVKSVDAPEKELIIPDDRTIKQIRTLANSHFRPLYLIIEIILKLGLKFNEIIALDEDDFNFKNRTITITKISYNGVKSEIKFVNQRRIVKFSSKFEPILIEFLNKKKYSEHMVKMNFCKVKKEMGLDKLKLDDFRHTFAYNFLKQTNSIEALSLRLGDPTLQITMDKYSKLMGHKILI